MDIKVALKQRHSKTPVQSPKRVLVVDDEPTIRELIADALREFGYQIETAPNGAEALEIMHRWLPDAIVLDLMMPRLNGDAFAELVRLNPAFAAVPVLLVTAAYGAQESAARIGARACLTKPFELDRLVELVGELTEPMLPLPSESAESLTGNAC